MRIGPTKPRQTTMAKGMRIGPRSAPLRSFLPSVNRLHHYPRSRAEGCLLPDCQAPASAWGAPSVSPEAGCYSYGTWLPYMYLGMGFSEN